MASTINSIAGGAGGIQFAGDSSGLLNIQSSGVTAIAIDASQNVNTAAALSVTGALTVQGLTVGRGGGAIATNTAVGTSALASNTTGATNTAVGYQAGYSNVTGQGLTLVGRLAGYNSTGDFNTFVGMAAGYSSTGTCNTFIGYSSTGLGSGQTMTTGSKNTIVGGFSGNQGGLDIRTSNNYIVLSDGDGNPRLTSDNNGSITAGVPGSPTGSFSSVNTFGFKNRLINGACVIDQRWAGGAVIDSTATNPFTVDRWSFYGNVPSKVSLQQNQGSVTPPTGFTNYMGMTTTTAYSPAAGDAFRFQQIIEGNNISDLAWGTASAKPVTVSFWVRSSLTGTFSGALSNSALNRSYPYTFTISAANTWTFASVTIPGCTDGTWLTTNGEGIRLFFNVGCGSSILGTAGSWANTFYAGVTGSVAVVSTNGATFQYTGVQLEAGSQATSFDFRSFGQELLLCQRYYEKSYDTDTAPGTVTAVGQLANIGVSNPSGEFGVYCKFAVPKRSAPTITPYNTVTGSTGAWTYQTSGAGPADAGANPAFYGMNGFFMVCGTVAAWIPVISKGHYTASAEL